MSLEYEPSAGNCFAGVWWSGSLGRLGILVLGKSNENDSSSSSPLLAKYSDSLCLDRSIVIPVRLSYDVMIIMLYYVVIMNIITLPSSHSHHFQCSCVLCVFSEIEAMKQMTLTLTDAH